MQLEFPWALGPPDGRYVVRGGAGAAPAQVVVVATLGAPQRRWLRGRGREIAPAPSPTPVATGRVTVVDAEPVDAAAAQRWLAAADAVDAERALLDVIRLVRFHRVASADPGVPLPQLSQALTVRAGYGDGEQVADGGWRAARELAPEAGPRERRRRGRTLALRPQERLAALLGGRSRRLACEELTLRARHDLDHGELREAALQLRAALDAAVAELPAGPEGWQLRERVEELRALRDGIVALAHDALGGVLPPDAEATLAHALGRLEAALRARTVAEDA